MRWRSIFIGTGAAALLLFFLFLSPSDPDIWWVFLVIPCVALLMLVLFVLLVVRRTRRLSAELLLTTFVFMGIMIVGMHFENMLRPKVRWTFFSQGFKRQVLRQPSDPSGDFKHVEWDGSGAAPVGDWTSYVVFDPGGLLQADRGRQHPGKVVGIPCDVLRVQRLEPHWYSITLEVSEYWDNCKTE